MFNAPQSTCSQRVRYTLHAKGLSFVEEKLDLFSGDQLRAEYLAINPNGVVPTLVDDGVAVVDSAVIMEYLEDRFPNVAPLRPATPIEAAKVRAMVRFIDEVPGPAVRIPSYNLAFLPHFQAMSEEEFQALADSKPLRREFLMKMGRTGFPKTELDEANGRLRRGCERAASWLKETGGPWLAGKAISMADVALMPVIVRLADIRMNSLWSDLPALEDWRLRIMAEPAFKATYYEGSLLTDKYPHLRESLDATAAK